MSTYIVGEYAVDGVEYVLAGNNIVIGGSPSLPIINAIPTSNLNIVAGLGMSVSQVNNTVTITNAGLLGVQAGNNIIISGNVFNPTISANINAISNITAGNGISISGTNTNKTITNTGVLNLIAGSGISLSGNSNITITATGGGGIGNGNMSSLHIPPFFQSQIGNPSGTSGATFEVGSFTIPLDAKANSNAYLYMKGYGYRFYQPSQGNACENYIGVSLNSGTDPVANWVQPYYGVVIVRPNVPPDPQINNPIPLYSYNTPNSISGVSAEGSTWSMFPVWLTLSNISPSSNVYIVWADAYGGYFGQNLTVDCPILLYETA